MLIILALAELMLRINSAITAVYFNPTFKFIYGIIFITEYLNINRNLPA